MVKSKPFTNKRPQVLWRFFGRAIQIRIFLVCEKTQFSFGGSSSSDRQKVPPLLCCHCNFFSQQTLFKVSGMPQEREEEWEGVWSVRY